MTATHPAFSFTIGDTWAIDAGLHNADNTPLDLSDAAVEWTLRNGASTVVATLSIGAGITVTNLIGGQIHIELPPDQTAALPAGTYYDQIKVTTSDQRVSTQAVGLVNASLVGVAPPPHAADLQAELDDLKAARRTGASLISINGREVRYRKDADLQAAIAATEAELARMQGVKRPMQVVVRSSKGW